LQFVSLAWLAQGASPSFMVMSGITGPDQCLAAVSDATAALVSCAEAIGSGDGKEVWSHESGGRLRNVVSDKCLEVSGGNVGLGLCAGKSGSAWELSSTGQLKLAGSDLCLTQSGTYSGDEDAAHGAPVHATSTSDQDRHGAVMAVDGNEKTYWAAGADGVQELTLDFGGARALASAVIEWEYPAEAFSLQLSSDGGASWTDAYATDVNGQFTSRIYLGYATAGKVRLVMKAAHPVYGEFRGQKVFGIRRFAVISPRLQTSVEKCDAAAKSADARDKFFMSFVSASDPCPAKQLRAEVPALESAITSLAAATSRLAAKFPTLGGCGVRSFLGVAQSPAVVDFSAASGVAAGRRVAGVPDAAAAIDAARDIIEKASAKAQ